MMERMLLGVLYLSGWIIPSCLLHQYHYVPDHKTWTEAQAYCRKNYTDLASIDNAEEMNRIIKTVTSSGNNSEVWLGVYGVINWMWSDGYNGSEAEYRSWDNVTGNEPDCYSVRQFCVQTDSNGRWQDDRCSHRYPFICYNGTQQDPEFVFMNESMNWSSAQNRCRENFTDLATVRNHTENQEIQNKVPNGTKAWIGLFREPGIHASDRSGSPYSNWNKGPNPISSLSRLCSVADFNKAGKWRLLPCDHRFPFVCYISGKRRIVKLRVKRGDPSVDLNDPAVKADILKKLQKELQDKGISGVNLKWREQPDGKVFHKEGETPQKKKSRKKTEL